MEFFAPIFIIVLIIVFLAVFFSFVPVGLWISATASGLKVGIGQLVAMRIRKVVPSPHNQPRHKVHQGGHEPFPEQIRGPLPCGRQRGPVVNALIAAQRAGIPLDFERACAIDLAGRDVLNAVQMSVNPKVIETPVIAAIAKDGIELRAKARVTVRANIDRLVGGAGEDHHRPYRRGGIVTTVGFPRATRTCLKTPTLYPRPCSTRALMQALRSKYSP